MAPESINQNVKKAGRFPPRLPVIVFLLVALIFWVKNQATSGGHSVQATGVDLPLEPQHNIPIPHWNVFDADGTMWGEHYWGKDNSNPNGGIYSAWCARDGANGIDPTKQEYFRNTDSWMVYGPFSLENYNAAELEFWYWNQSEEDSDYLYWMASILTSNFYGDEPTSGNSNGWQKVIFDLGNVPQLGDITGVPEVRIAFRFTSDGNNINNDEYSYDGAFVDDIVLKARKPGNIEWEILMSEDFEGQFPPVLELESTFIPVTMKLGS